MTRSHKANAPVHGAEPQGAQAAQDALPKNFGKYSTHSERAKKNGGGKANWGRDGDELMDNEEFKSYNTRRRSNSKGHIEDMFVVSKFEENEEEPFDEVVRRVETSSSTSSETTDKS